MEYVHIRNLEKYHPKFKDRNLIWCKLYFSTLNSDDVFMRLCEVDKWRFFAFVMMSLQGRSGVLLDALYLRLKGFNFKVRRLETTLIALEPLIEVRTYKEIRYQDDTEMIPKRYQDVPLDKDKEKDKEKEKEKDGKKGDNNTCLVKKKVVKKVFDFEVIWLLYPKKIGKPEALEWFIALVKTEKDYEDIVRAVSNYKKYVETNNIEYKFIKNGGNWFKRWRDWVDWEEPKGVKRESGLEQHRRELKERMAKNDKR